MRSYLDIGVDFILTNRPKRAVKLIGSDKIPLPGSAFKDCGTECSFHLRAFGNAIAVIFADS